MYVSIKREDRESFFKYVYADSKLNEINIEKIVNNINIKYPIFYSLNAHYLAKSIYGYGDKNIKTTMLRLEISEFEKYLEVEELRKKYVELKTKLYGNVKTIAFGKKAETSSASITLNQDTFFRKPSIDYRTDYF